MMHLVFCASCFYKCWPLELQRKLVLSANLAPEIGFHSPGKESCFLGLFWYQNVILVLVVLGYAIKYCHFDVILHFHYQYQFDVH